MSVTMSQPHTVVTGPPQNQAVAKEPVTPVGKDRMQNETPKLVSTAKTKPSGASGAGAAACKASFCSCALHYAAGAKAVPAASARGLRGAASAARSASAARFARRARAARSAARGKAAEMCAVAPKAKPHAGSKAPRSDALLRPRFSSCLYPAIPEVSARAQARRAGACVREQARSARGGASSDQACAPSLASSASSALLVGTTVASLDAMT